MSTQDKSRTHAYRQGWNACQENLTCVNPYLEGDDNHDAWEQGWTDASNFETGSITQEAKGKS
jgi:hypothetical protein